MDPQGHQHKRASHSGPLSHRAAWAKAGRNPDDAPKIYTGADLSTISSLEAVRRSLLSEDHRERSGLSQPEVPKLMARFPGSFKETLESFAQQDPKHLSQGVAGSLQKEDGRNNSKDPVLVSHFTLHFSFLSLFVWFCFFFYAKPFSEFFNYLAALSWSASYHASCL